MDKETIFIKRKVDTKIQDLLKLPEIIAIIGPRQSGKTTYLKHLLLNKSGNFISFEDREILALFNNDIKKFALQYLSDTDLLCIDEFQYAKNGGKNLKYLFDFYPGKKIIISGSSAVDLTIHAIRYLVGRVIIVPFWNFDLEELQVVFPNFTKEEMFNYYAQFGGYPRVALASSDNERKEIIKNIYNTYFLREVKDILGIVDEYKLQKLIIALASSVGSVISYESISNQCDIPKRDLKKYIEFINKTFIACSIIPFFTNKLREIVKQPKIYFYDTGLLQYILNNSVDKGKVLEQVVFMELVKNNYTVKYWRDKKSNEVDFIIERDVQVVMALECKYNDTSSTKSSNAFKAQYKIPLKFIKKDEIFNFLK